MAVSEPDSKPDKITSIIKQINKIKVITTLDQF